MTYLITIYSIFALGLFFEAFDDRQRHWAVRLCVSLIVAPLWPVVFAYWFTHLLRHAATRVTT
jgi:hypothetical protein